MTKSGYSQIECLKQLDEIIEKCRYWGCSNEVKEKMIKFLIKEGLIEPEPEWEDDP